MKTLNVSDGHHIGTFQDLVHIDDESDYGCECGSQITVVFAQHQNAHTQNRPTKISRIHFNQWGSLFSITNGKELIKLVYFSRINSEKHHRNRLAFAKGTWQSPMLSPILSVKSLHGCVPNFNGFLRFYFFTSVNDVTWTKHFLSTNPKLVVNNNFKKSPGLVKSWNQF